MRANIVKISKAGSLRESVHMRAKNAEKMSVAGAGPILKLRKLGGHLKELQNALIFKFWQAIVAHSHSLIIILVLSVLLILSQELFLWGCPALIKAAAPIALFLDMIFLYLDLEASIFAAAWDVIALIVDAIPGLNAHLKPLPVWPFTTSKGVLALPSASEIKAALVKIHAECGSPAYFDAWKITNYAFATLNGNQICAFVRFFYPVRWLYDFFEFFLSWTYVGSARPFPGPSDSDDNCNEAGDKTYVLPPPTCIALGTGWILLEVVVPFYIGIIFFARCGPSIFNVFKDTVVYSLDIIKAIIF